MLLKGDFRDFYFELETLLDKLVKVFSHFFQKNNFEQKCRVFYFHQKLNLFSNRPCLMLSWNILSGIILLRWHEQVRPTSLAFLSPKLNDVTWSHETGFNTVMVVAKDNSKNLWHQNLIGREQNKNIYLSKTAYQSELKGIHWDDWNTLRRFHYK